MAGIQTCDRESQVQRPNHYTTESLCEQVAQLLQRDRGAGGLVMAISEKLELGDNILRKL